MNSLVVCFSGKIGSGKSTLSNALAKQLNWPLASFGDYVRKVAKSRNLDFESKLVLQEVGELLINEGWERFCINVLNEANWHKGDSLVIDGIRHVECLKTIEKLVYPLRVFLIFVDLEDQTRLKRIQNRNPEEASLLKVIENHSTELQVNSQLRGHANLIVYSNESIDNVVAQIMGSLNI